jgi:ubiquinone/menaquinone biosynthesis C-methylase UbiE
MLAARGCRPDVLRQWLDIIASHVQADAEVVVDLGCGTGRFTHALAYRLKTRVIGIDPSEKMLHSARKYPIDPRVEFRRAAAEFIPLHEASADVIFLSMALLCLRRLNEGGPGIEYRPR